MPFSSSVALAPVARDTRAAARLEPRIPLEFGEPPPPFPAPDLDVSASRVVPLSSTTRNPYSHFEVSSQLLAEWHGQVTEVLASSFVAELRGRHGQGVVGNSDVAVIPFDEVRLDDQELLRVGAFFSLCVSYEISKQGRRKYTEVVFRRLPAYRLEELERAREEARETFRGLRLE